MHDPNHHQRNSRYDDPQPSGRGHRRFWKPPPEEMLSARFIVGLIIIALGAILLCDNLGLFDARYVLRSLWPLALVAIGVVMVRSPERRGRGWGWVLITLGIWIFADRIGWIHISLWQLLIPGLLLFIGGTLVWRSLSGPPKEPSSSAVPDDHSEFVRSFALMSSCVLRPVSRPFRGADLSVVMGGIRLDLSDARMEGDTATVEIFGFCGGMEIHVPPDWTVTSKVTTLMGGFIDKRRPTSVLPSKTLIVRGMSVMSGIEVKN